MDKNEELRNRCKELQEKCNILKSKYGATKENPYINDDTDNLNITRVVLELLKNYSQSIEDIGAADPAFCEHIIYEIDAELLLVDVAIARNEETNNG